MASSSTIPVAPKPIKINITDGVKGQPITIRNRNNGDEIHTTLFEDAKGIVDLQNFDNEYTAGHVVDFIVSGEQLGSNSLTTAGDAPQTVTVATSTIGTSLARGI